MPNRARRLRNLYEKARSIGSNRNVKAVDVWGEVFGMENARTDTLMVATVQRHLAMIAEELSRLERQLQAEGFDPATHERMFNQARAAISPLTLGSSWKGGQGNKIDSGLMQGLGTLGDLLGKQEAEVPESELQEYKEGLLDLSKRVSEADVSGSFASLLQSMIDVLLRAAREYEIKGAAAFAELRAEIEQLLADFEQTWNPAEATTEEQSFVDELKGYFVKADRWGGYVLRVYGLAELIQKALPG